MNPWFRSASQRRDHARGVVAILQQSGDLGLVHLLSDPDDERPLVSRCLFQPAVGEPSPLLAEWVQRYGLGRSRFVGLLNREEYLLFPYDAPDLPRGEWGMNIRWKIADRLGYPAEQAVVETFDLPGSATQETSGKIYVAVAPETTVQRKVDLFLNADLPLWGLDMADLALGRLTDTLPEDARGLGLLYWTGEGGVIQVRRRQTLFLSRTLETRRQPIWRALENATPSIPPEADHAALDHLATELRRTFHFYENNFLQPPLDHLFVMPTNPSSRDLPWRTGDPLDHMTPGQTESGYAWRSEPVMTPPPAPIPWALLEERLLAALADRLGMRVSMLPLERVMRRAPDVQEADLIDCLPAIGAALGGLSGS